MRDLTLPALLLVAACSTSADKPDDSVTPSPDVGDADTDADTDTDPNTTDGSDTPPTSGT
jgi:hypothetical protein